MALIKTDLNDNPTKINSLNKIAQEVCDKHGISCLSQDRSNIIAAARYEFFYRALAETDLTSYKIARIICCDHTTVRYGASRYALHNDLLLPRGWSFDHKALDSEKRNYPKTRKQKKAATVLKYLKKRLYETDMEREMLTARQRAKESSAALLERLREVHG